MRRLAVALMGFGFLCGCTANENSIFRTYTAEPHKVALIDAKQRAILSNTVTTGRLESDKPILSHRICTEPSPDVFSVLSSAISASGTFSDQAGNQVAAQFARSISEAGTNIGVRTQTVQVLRDMMYRLCERYLNGAITADEFAVQASRDQRIIVSVLAIEQLTGAVQPRPVVISATSEADAGANIGQLQTLLDDARAELEKAKAEQEAAKKAKESAAAKKEEADKALAADAQNAAKKEAAKKAEGDLKATEEVLKKADAKVSDREKNLAAIVSQIERARNVAARGGASGYVAPPAVPAPTAKEVASAVENIVSMTFAVDETTLVCLKTLEKSGSLRATITTDQNPGLNFCLKYLARKGAEEDVKSEKAEKALELLRKKTPDELFGDRP